MPHLFRFPLAPALAAAGLLLGAVPTVAVPVQWSAGAGGNDHYYEFVQDNGISWTDAKTAAETLSHLGNAGHLATITSADENAFVYTSFHPNPSFRLAWLGASQPQGETDPLANWGWVTGEAFSYTNWAGGEPSDTTSPGSEQYLQMKGSGAGSSIGTWNDDANIADPASFLTGYLVEYTAVPEPGSAMLILAGTGAMLLRRKSTAS